MTDQERAEEPQRRIKIYTVHGTFAHEAEWDNWKDDLGPDDPEIPFVNRLSGFLKDEGIAFSKVDHEQYNWSGGNSHDERRIAAINLKRHIESDLIQQFEGANDLERAVRDHYNGGVFVVGHSHGGTVARLAMNLWDKSYDYYEPLLSDDLEAEVKTEDKCPVCKQSRGIIDDRPNEIPRPDGIITFGSPFVRFEKRAMGLASTQILIWVLRIAGLAGMAFLMTMPWIEATNLTNAIHFLWPFVVFWLVTFYLPQRKNKDGLKGKSAQEKTMARAIRFSRSLIYWGAVTAMALYYYVQFYSGDSGFRDSIRLDNNVLQVLVPVVIYWLVLVSMPHRLLKRVGKEVQTLRAGLPAKYDPDEVSEDPARYLCYHTPGDEAGLHLRIFGFLTWFVQTLLLTAAIFFGFTIVLGLVVAAFLIFTDLINMVGLSPSENGDRFAGLMNGLSEIPRNVWNFFAPQSWELSAFDPAQINDEVATNFGEWLFIIAAASIVFLMPLIVVVVGVAYFISMTLRGSGLVFGSEKMTWTMANRITAKRTANSMTKRRRFFIAPEAWWNLEMAHCYFYKCDRVIKDVAEHISTWNSGAFKPSRNWPVERVLALTTSWLIVMFFILSIFAIAVHTSAVGMV